jgi:flagellar basal-body rod protein FlgB
VEIGGTHTQTLAAALRGLEAQRQASEFNISNVETPGFKARVVSFEDSLRRAVHTGNPAEAGLSTNLSTDPTRIDGNNVDLEKELTSLELNSLQQRLMTQALNDHFGRIRSALGNA